DRPTPPMSKELPKWAAMRGNSARRVLRNGQKGVRFRSGWETTGGAPDRTRPGTPPRLVVVACAATRRSRLARALVHLLDEVLVLALHHGPLQLQARGDLAVLDVEVARQETELLDGLPALQALVELLDVAVDHLDRGRGGDDVRVGLALHAVLRRPGGEGGLVEGDEGGAVVPVGAVHQDVGDVGADRLELALDLGGRDVLAAGGLDQVLLAVGDAQVAADRAGGDAGAARLDLPLGVGGREVLAAGGLDQGLLAVGDAQVAVGRQLTDVPGVDPAVRLQHLGGLLGQVVVALHDAGAAQQDLAVVGDPHLGAGQRLADGTGAVGLAGVDEGGRGGLGEPVALQDVHAGAGEQGAYVRV